jgi:ribonuclease HI
MKDDQGDLDLTLLIENHQKQIWDFKKRESQWIMDKNQLEGNQKIISELSAKLVDVTRSNVELKNKLTDAEGETSLVKAIGINSPEMKALQQINEDHKKINGDLQKALTTLEQENIEIHTDNIKLSRQIEDLLKRKDKDKY